MSVINEDSLRFIVPRWRNFADTSRNGELRSVRAPDRAPIDQSLLNDLVDEWRSTKSLSIAADLVSASVAIGHGAVATEAASFILEQSHAPKPARDLAEMCLDGGVEKPSPSLFREYGFIDFGKVQAGIHDGRKRLAEAPRNPILWTNLALLYTTLGNTDKANRAVRIALSLAPHNRFILRSACRFYLHIGDQEQAHSILTSNPLVRKDPWVLAAEIAVSSVRNRTSRLVKHARQIVDQQTIAPHHLSELSGALATIEAFDGAFKRARNLCIQSLEVPSENAIAQVAWLSRNVHSMGFESRSTIANSHEASAWAARRDGNWENALSQAVDWQEDQPFSSRPAMLGSHAALTALERFHEAEHILKRSRLSNPDDPGLLNNLAFALAKQNKVDEAIQVVNVATELSDDPQQDIFLMATRGLIEFRAGNPDGGRFLYLQAISSAHRQAFYSTSSIASTYLAMEEVRINSEVAPAMVKMAEDNLAKLPSDLKQVFQVKLDRLKLHETVE